MKISEIPVKDTITSSEINNGYFLGMKDIYPDDENHVYELQKFPLAAYLSNSDLKTTENLVKRIRNLETEVVEQKQKLQTTVSNIKQISQSDVESAHLQPIENTISYEEVTSQLTSVFVSPEEFQTTINNIYSSLFSAVEEMMVQVFTTSMYARQYVRIKEDPVIGANDTN